MNETASARLLLVDDEAALREPLAEYLSRQGFVVDQAASAAEARSLLRDENARSGPARYHDAGRGRPVAVPPPGRKPRHSR